jgi:hypothetical protein
MAMQTLPIIERLVQLDISGRRGCAEIIDIHMAQAVQLHFQRAKHSVVFVARVTRFVRGHAMILKMGCRNVSGVVDVQAFSVRFHGVARQAERRGFRSIHLAGNAHRPAKYREQEQDEERQNFPDARRRNARTRNEHANQGRAKQNENDD